MENENRTDSTRHSIKNLEHLVPDCTDCNACCMFFSSIPLEEGEIIDDSLVELRPNGKRYMLIAENANGLRSCVALQADGKCGIYDSRPKTCRIFPRACESCFLCIKKIHGIDISHKVAQEMQK